MSIKVFISQPMAGRPEKDILEERQKVMAVIRKRFNDPDMEDVGYCSDDVPGKFNVWYLGGSLQRMEDANIIIFCPKWKNARGCVTEYVVARMYRKLYDWTIYFWDGVSSFEKAPTMHGMIELPIRYW